MFEGQKVARKIKAFRKEVVCNDEALSCVMKAMWNYKLPEVMQDNEEQLSH